MHRTPWLHHFEIARYAMEMQVVANDNVMHVERVKSQAERKELRP